MNNIIKRTMDIVLSSIGLVILSPLMLLISILIWIDSPGPVFYSQFRIGKNKKIFRIYKFRKFPPTWKDEGPCVTTCKDPRMTTIGSFIERTKIDELPQLWNILIGEMSFVGPRPESLKFIDLFSGEYSKLLNYTPGIFGPNQVLFRNESEWYIEDEDPELYYRRILFPQKAENDLKYFLKTNCFKDIITIFKGSLVTFIGVLNWKRFLKRDLFIIAIDVFLIAVSWFMASVLRFSSIPSGEDLLVLITGIEYIPPLIIAGMIIGGCYRCPLKYFTLSSAARFSVAIFISWMATFFIIIKLYRNISLYLLPMAGSLSVILLLIPRVLARWEWEKTVHKKYRLDDKILIYGAGRVGMALVSCLPISKFIGLIDDNPDYRGMLIGGLKVYGHESDIPTINKVHPFKELWVTFNPSPQKRDRLFSICKTDNIKLVLLAEIEPFVAVKVTENLDHVPDLSCQL